MATNNNNHVSRLDLILLWRHSLISRTFRFCVKHFCMSLESGLCRDLSFTARPIYQRLCCELHFRQKRNTGINIVTIELCSIIHMEFEFGYYCACRCLAPNRTMLPADPELYTKLNIFLFFKAHLVTINFQILFNWSTRLKHLVRYIYFIKHDMETPYAFLALCGGLISLKRASNYIFWSLCGNVFDHNFIISVT